MAPMRVSLGNSSEHLLGKLTTQKLFKMNNTPQPIGTGPFKFVNGSRRVHPCRKNENYWRGSDYPKVDECVLLHAG